MQKKCISGEQPYSKKAIFAVPIERETGYNPRGEREWETFIERMEGCSKYSRIFLRFASDKVGTDKNKKEIN